MTARAEILFANQAFYDVFRSRDMTTMEQLWSRREDVACVHPGWHALIGREEVIESWRGILSNPASPQIVCRHAEAFLAGETGFVVCYEIIEDNVLVATNVFVREAGAWKLVHHQAGPCNLPPTVLEDDEEDEPPAMQ